MIEPTVVAIDERTNTVLHIWDFGTNIEAANTSLIESLDIRATLLKDDPEDFRSKELVEEYSNTKHVIMSYLEYKELEFKKLDSDPVKEITEEEYWDCLEVLPPIWNGTHGGVEMFMVRECYSADFYTQCGKLGDKYYKKLAHITNKSTWIHNNLA